MIGTTIGKYKIIGKLGRGGMGTVYKAVDETLDREVAIKALNSDVSDAKLMARFRAEAITLARLNHPQIATIFEIYKTDDDLLMVMELVRGETLEQLAVRRGPLAPDQAAGLLSQVLGGLSHAHHAGIVHRDLKPANMMITESGVVKIMDFGIARVLGAEHLTSDGTMIGTPAYMAPEQIVGKDLDARADLYSVGVVFYRLLSGCLPFQADTPISMVQKQLWDPPAPVRSHRADLPEWCDTILTRALAKSPADRFQTADEFRAALLAAGGNAAERYATDSGTYALSAFAAPTALAATPSAIVAPESPAPVDVPDQMPTVTQVRHVPVAEPPTPIDAGTLPAAAKPAAASQTPPRARRPVPMVAIVAAALVLVAAIAGLTMFRRARGVPAASTSPTTAANDVSNPPDTNAASPEVTPAAEAIATDPQTDATKAAAADGAAAGIATAKPQAPVARVTPPVVPAPKPNAAVVEADTAAPPAAPLEATPAVPSTAGAMPPVVFSAQTVVVEGGKNRQRDTNVELANGVVTVTGKDNKLVTTVPYGSVVGLTYSNSKQPMWNTPQGPAEIMHLDGGAFGFLKGDQNWVSLRTDTMSLVLRVRDQDSLRVINALEERIGKKVDRVEDRKTR